MKSVCSNKSGKLNQHFSSNSHKVALADFAHFAIKCSNVDVIMSKQAKEILIQRNNFDSSGRGRHTAFRGKGDDKDGNFVQIVNLLSRHCPRSAYEALQYNIYKLKVAK